MKKRLPILLVVILLLLLVVLVSARSNPSQLTPTRTFREGMTYGGQNCIMYQGKLYWEQSINENPPLDTLELVGTVQNAVDQLPEQDFDSAVTAVGSEIYYTDNNPGVLVVKEDGTYYIYGLQDNSFVGG